VAHLPQSVRPDLPFLAGELALMGRYPHTDRWFESDAIVDMDAAMRRTDCWDLRHRLMQTLSGGERQRVLLAACVAQAQKLLLLDEPSTHLDVDQQLHCFSMLKEASAEGAACVAVTHDPNLALTYATRIVVIADGRCRRSHGRGGRQHIRVAVAVLGAPDAVVERPRPGVGVVHMITTPDNAVAAGAAARARSDPRSGARWIVLFAIAFAVAMIALPIVGPFALNLERVRARQDRLVDSVQLRVTRTLLGLFAGSSCARRRAIPGDAARRARDALHARHIRRCIAAVVTIWFVATGCGVAHDLGRGHGRSSLVRCSVGAALQQRRVSSFSLLLAGLAANSTCSAFIIAIYRSSTRARPSRLHGG
jgi:energy-coupling factor transporter ATP-binding protein EcfA2